MHRNRTIVFKLWVVYAEYMAEHLSGHQPEQAQDGGLPFVGDTVGDIEGAYSLLAEDELDQMRQAAAEVAADIQAGQQPIFSAPPPFDADVPLAFVSVEGEEEASPVWGAEPIDEQIYPEEALSQSQREHAQHYYLTLTSLAHHRYRQEETLPEPQELIEAYAAYWELTELENQNLPPAERLPSFTLAHLWAAARRYNAWVTQWIQEHQAYEATEEFEEALFILFSLENRLAVAVQRATV
jgi:hypothetical protein